ncbi:MAG: hypothetical protein KGS61_17380 [Verrucomicrobia bacterium]|nr:hypothetical protein [Verrucomicrobiota bacterium]
MRDLLSAAGSVSRRPSTILLLWLLICGGTPVVSASAPSAGADEPTYKTGYKSMRMLGLDLWKALKPKFRKQIHPEPISFETDVTPFVHVVEFPNDPEPMRMVFISVGFIDLVNNIAHAKAIDRIQKGYFKQYVLSLAQESGEKELKELPGLSDKRFWTEDVLNEQLSNFNQIVGVVVGIKLAHHYLGQYLKYKDELKDDAQHHTVSINNLLTPKEWDAALRCGVIDALNCGLSIEGVEALYDAIDEMPKRPPWTVNFLPDQVNVKGLKKEMKKMEREFFSGKNLE